MVVCPPLARVGPCTIHRTLFTLFETYLMILVILNNYGYKTWAAMEEKKKIG